MKRRLFGLGFYVLGACVGIYGVYYITNPVDRLMRIIGEMFGYYDYKPILIFALSFVLAFIGSVLMILPPNKKSLVFIGDDDL